MKVWAVMLVWALTLSCVFTSKLVLQNPKRTSQSRPSEPHKNLDLISHRSQRNAYSQDPFRPHANKHLDQPAHSDIIYRMKRSPKQRGAKRKRPSGEKKGRGAGVCALRRVQMKVSDLGLGYKSQEELIYSYCSGVCINSLTNYDKILNSLTANDKTRLLYSPPTACCRPIEFDDDLSFLDDNLIYHTMEKHSARKCGCV
nr:glial cell line-derived neurotrophic factor [Misgurnus anguillicaudatus]